MGNSEVESEAMTSLEEEARKEELKKKLQSLSNVERTILQLRISGNEGIPMSYAAIGKRLDMSVGMVQRNELTAVNKLRSTTEYQSMARRHYYKPEVKEDAST